MRWSVLITGLIGCLAPDALSDDEDVLPRETDFAPGGDVAATADGWSAQTADAGGNGTIEATLTATLQDDGTVACAHTGLSVPCGDLRLGGLRWDDAAREARVTYVSVPDDSAATCLWSMTYTLRWLGSQTGTVIASATLEDGTPLAGTEARAEWAP
jgi:hypothetical protein